MGASLASDRNTLRSVETLEHSARRVLIMQAVLTVALILLTFGYSLVSNGLEQGIPQGRVNAIGCLYGALLGMVNTMISKRSVARSSRAAMKSPQYAMLPVYMGLLNKLLIVGGGLAIGLVALGLEPIFVVSGYLITQLALIWVAAKAP
ncbi:MAG: ATP synthase subunit I [bacterium]